MEKFFKLNENKTNVKTEFVAGLTTFLTMAYVLFVNPAMLAQTGMNQNAVFIATVLAAVIGTLIMGLIANVPFAQAPGMGLNAFFTYTVCFGMGFKWQEALAMVFICGLINILITVTKIRKLIITAIPESLQYAISGGIGLFIAYIGFINGGFLTFTGDVKIGEPNVFAKIIPALTQFNNLSVLVCALGVIVTVFFILRKNNAAILIGIIVTTIVAHLTGVTSFSMMDNNASIADISKTFMKLDIPGLFSYPGKILLIISTIFAFSLTDTFDTIGTFLGTGRKAGIFDEKDDEEFHKGNNFNSKLERALFADATATSIGAILGTSNTTTYVESASGIAAGGRTGLTSVFTAVFFLLSLFFLPYIGLVPAIATAPALIVVGVFMASSIGKINWEDLTIAIPCFFTMALMPLSYSITSGVSIGFIMYCTTMLATGQGKKVKPIMYIITGLFIISIALTAIVK